MTLATRPKIVGPSDTPAEHSVPLLRVTPGSGKWSTDSWSILQQEVTASQLSTMRKRFSALSTVTSALQKNTLSTLSVIAIAFFNVSGGPWGSEPMFQPGPIWGILGILGVTLCWGLPQSLITAELSAAMPVNGGYSVWVTEAFGPFWGMLECYFSWVSGVVDNAIYPVLIFDSAAHLFGNVTPTTAKLIKVIIALVLSIPNFISTIGATRILEYLTVLSMLPFFVFIIVALPKVEPEQLVNDTPPAENVDWCKWILVVFWNLSGWDCVSTIAGEVSNPAFNMIWALMVSLCFTAFQYIVILGTAAAQKDRLPFAQWTDGSLTQIVTLSCGHWMGYCLLIASILGNAGMYIAELMEDSYQLQGVANHRRSFLPKALARTHPRYDTPWAAIGFSMLCIIPAVCFDFSQLLSVDNCFSSIAALLEFAAYVRLVRGNVFPRPYKAPRWIMMVGIPIAGIFGTVVFFHSLTKSTHAFIVNSLAMLLGVPLAYFVAYPRRLYQYVSDDEWSSP